MAPNLFQLWQRLPSGWKRNVRGAFYNGLSRFRPTPEVTFLNFGYAELDGRTPLELEGADAIDRFPLQLYERTARQSNWSGLDALEVGCGRGGGASFVMRHFAPKSYLGIDLAESAVRLCSRTHQIDGLHFRQGDAMNLPLADSSVDIVINIESSGLYPSIDRFYGEVFRVLRPAGRFLCADYRKTVNIERWRRHIIDSDLELVREVDITANVAEALVLDRAHREEMISKQVPRFLRSTFLHFAGLPPNEDEPFGQRKKTYLCLELAKPPEGSP